MAENPRIEELRRRVQADPASIAFAALAEEFRRVGRYDDAVETCRTGLLRHPAYLSARVTLGRALIETGDFDAAREELETVLRSAPENLVAIRGLAQIQERLGQSTEIDPSLADLVNTTPAQPIRVAAAPETSFAPEPPVSAPEPSFAAEPSFLAPEPTLAPEPSYAPRSGISLEPASLDPMAPPPDTVPLDNSLSGWPPASFAPEPPRATESFDAAPAFPLDDAPEAPAAVDPFAAFAPRSAPAKDLSFDLLTAFTVQPKAAPAEPAADLMSAPAAGPGDELPAEPSPEPAFEALPRDAEQTHTEWDLGLNPAPEPAPEPEPEPELETEPEPVLQMAPATDRTDHADHSHLLSVSSVARAAAGPDPETLATLARLERFLGAIESLRA